MDLLEEHKQAAKRISQLETERVDLVHALKELYEFSDMCTHHLKIERSKAAFLRAEAIVKGYFWDTKSKEQMATTEQALKYMLPHIRAGGLQHACDIFNREYSVGEEVIVESGDADSDADVLTTILCEARVIEDAALVLLEYGDKPFPIQKVRKTMFDRSRSCFGFQD
jgi:hypothetical protein